MSRGPAIVLTAKGNPGLLGCYGRALEKRMEVIYWNLDASVERNIKHGRVGRMLNSYFPIEPWVLGANRELIIEARRRAPRMIILAGAAPVRAGALAQIKAACPDTSLVMLWPDTLLNLSQHVIQALPLFDLVGSYSLSAIPLLEKLGARRVEFLPFAADLELFPVDTKLSVAEESELASDVCFVGNHRPEREQAILQLLDAGLKVKVWGVDDWVRNSSAPRRIQEYFQHKPLFGGDFVKAVRASKMCLNVIDPTNYPAANMRFFETYACKGVPLSSACPEMESEFPDRHSCMYFDEASMVQKALELRDDPLLRARIAEAGFSRTAEKHTYVRRAEHLCDALESRQP